MINFEIAEEDLWAYEALRESILNAHIGYAANGDTPSKSDLVEYIVENIFSDPS